MKQTDIQIIIILTLIGISTIILETSLNLVYAESQNRDFVFWDSVGWWLEKAGIVGVLATVLVYWHQQRNDKRKEDDAKEKERKRNVDRMLRSCDAIIMELDDHDKALNTDRHTPAKRSYSIGANFYR